MSEDAALEAYLKKLMDMELQPEQQLLTDEQLKEIALQSLTEREYNDMLRKAETMLQQGRTYLKQYNWKDAADTLEQVVAMRPNSVEANMLAGKAWMNIGSINDDMVALDKAEAFLDRSLRLDPNNTEALRLKGQHGRREETEVKEASKKKWLKIGIPAVVGLLLIMWLSSANSGMAGEAEKVKAAWAQVENVYARRADLIPNLVRTVKAAAQYNSEALKSLESAQQNAGSTGISADNLNSTNMNQYYTAQQQVSRDISQLMATFQGQSTYQDLMTQLEGSENRISVERKRFNEAARNYNTKRKSFPNSLLGWDEIPYFKADAGQMEKPKVNFN